VGVLGWTAAAGYPGLPAARAGALQFWSLGDQGTGSWGPHKQGDVAAAMTAVLPRYPDSRFTLGLGDNFYLVRALKEPYRIISSRVPSPSSTLALLYDSVHGAPLTTGSAQRARVRE
jgi:hypothetical protein